MDGIDAIEQILSEFAIVYHLLQVAVGGANQSYVDGNLLASAHSYDASALQGGKEFCLKTVG